jgi:Bacterial conjugation TrbI-like protein
MVHNRTLLVGATAGLLLTAVFVFALFQRGGARRLGRRQEEVVRDAGKITDAMTTSLRNFNPVLPRVAKPVSTPKRRSPPAQIPSELQQTQVPAAASLTLVAADPQPERSPERGPKGNYAPAFRMVKCQLVNTVDSSNLKTPIIGLVSDDVWWNGQVIVRANSEVHGLASVDTVRERIASNGEFTLVLNEPSGIGRELVVRGMVLDMEHDDRLDSFGITDGSAGLRGDVIRTANNDVIKLYAASLINGIAGAFSSGASGVFGNRVYTNGNALGLSALQNGVVNPAVGGTQAVLDRYASQIASSIERDGFFIRVPAGKQFYLYCMEAIDLSHAKVAADDERLVRDEADFQKKKMREEVRRALPVDPSELLSPLVPALEAINHNNK